MFAPTRRLGFVSMLAFTALVSTTPAASEGLDDAAARDRRGGAIAAPDGRCGTFDFGPADLPRAPGKDYDAITDAATATVKVAFHVISKEIIKNGVKAKIGDVSSAKLDAQIKILNAAFAGAGVTFTKDSVDRITNNTWFAMTMGSAAESAAKRALAKDPAHRLNVYVCGIPNGHLGWAYYPWSFPESSTLHGLVLLYTTLPGGSLSGYNKGDTAVHEIGHYLGLYHTFERGCSTSGDLVADTPPEATPAYSCTPLRDTCAAPGLDPIHNYMDYGNDACMTEFTAGQCDRMDWALATYKPGLSAAGTEPPAAAPESERQIQIVSVTPNPFNPTTTIEFALGREAHVTLRIIDVGGRQAAVPVAGVRAAGTHRVTFGGRGLASGVYFAVLQAGNERVQERMVLLK